MPAVLPWEAQLAAKQEFQQWGSRAKCRCGCQTRLCLRWDTPRLAAVSPAKKGLYGVSTEKPAQPTEKALRTSWTCKTDRGLTKVQSLSVRTCYQPHLHRR